MVIPEKEAPVTGTTFRTTGIYVITLPDKLGIDPVAVDGIDGSRRGKQ